MDSTTDHRNEDIKTYTSNFNLLFSLNKKDLDTKYDLANFKTYRITILIICCLLFGLILSIYLYFFSFKFNEMPALSFIISYSIYLLGFSILLIITIFSKKTKTILWTHAFLIVLIYIVVMNSIAFSLWTKGPTIGLTRNIFFLMNTVYLLATLFPFTIIRTVIVNVVMMITITLIYYYQARTDFYVEILFILISITYFEICGYIYKR